MCGAEIANIVVKAVFSKSKEIDVKMMRLYRNITGIVATHRDKPAYTITISGIKKFDEIPGVIRAFEEKVGPCRRYEIVNIVATFKTGRKVDLELLASSTENASCNLERFPGVIVKVSDRIRGVIFSTGHVNITGARSLEEITEAERYLRELINLWG